WTKMVWCITPEISWGKGRSRCTWKWDKTVIMKKHLYLWLIILSFNCNSEDAADCFQTRGTTVQQQIDVPEFTKILVNRNIQLIVKQGAQAQVVVETGENLISDVEVEVVAG